MLPKALMAPWLPWVSAAAIITIHRTFGSVAGGEGEFKEAAGTSKDRDEGQGHRHHVRPECADEVSADDIGHEVRNRSEASQPPVIEALIALHRIGGDEIV